ncbi:MAG: integrase core domain-containing protein [Candidatus Competibacteraceae bacterium]|nr:integrase core domain-containing protein [Candidatus Competibacteraceae bacterium]
MKTSSPSVYAPCPRWPSTICEETDDLTVLAGQSHEKSRQGLNSRQELEGQLPVFQQWYNDRRLHSRLGYRTPALVLAAEAAETLT